MAARSKAWFCGSSLAGIVGSNPAGGHGCLSPVNVVCCQVEVFASGLISRVEEYYRVCCVQLSVITNRR